MSSKDTFDFLVNFLYKYISFSNANEIQLSDNVVPFWIRKYLNAEKVLQCACIYLM